MLKSIFFALQSGLMEFYALASPRFTPEALQQNISGSALPQFSPSILHVLQWDTSRDAGEIFCLWGQFIVNRELLQSGLRFTLPKCPNALAWTVTAEEDGTLIHCTINRKTHEPDFIESIETFVDEWRHSMSHLQA
jgi:hypothetical protein